MISIGLRGRFGNHIFQYVNGRIVADKLGVNFCLPTEGIFTNGLSEVNKFLGGVIFNNCDLGVKYVTQTKIFDEKHSGYQKDIVNVVDGTHLNGFWQSDKYFEGYENKIRDWLKIEDLNNEYLRDEYCVIHFRANDGYLRMGWCLPKKYFIDAKKEIINRIGKHIKFVIVSDNKELAEKYFKGDIILSNDMKTDFQLLQLCKYKIISNSTFSWWAAWLGMNRSEIVIAPDRWINYNKPNSVFFPEDIRTKGFKYI